MAKTSYAIEEYSFSFSNEFLTIRNNLAFTEHYDELLKRLQSDPSINTISYGGPEVDAEVAKNIKSLIEKNKQITSYYISACTKYEQIEIICKYILELNAGIKNISCSIYAGIGDEEIIKISEILKGLDIVKLSFPQQNITDKGAIGLANSLQGKITLEELDLSNNEIGAAGAIELANSLQGNATLKELNLSNNKIGDAGAIELANSLQGNATLEELNLSNNKIGDAGAIELANSLQGNATLEELNLSNNKIGDAGATEIANSLQDNISLKHLDLMNNLISDEGMRSLVNVLLSIRALEFLAVGINSVNPESESDIIEDLLKACSTTLSRLNIYDISAKKHDWQKYDPDPKIVESIIKLLPNTNITSLMVNFGCDVHAEKVSNILEQNCKEQGIMENGFVGEGKELTGDMMMVDKGDDGTMELAGQIGKLAICEEE